MTLIAEHILLDTFGSDFDSLPPSLFKDFTEDGFNAKKKSTITTAEEDLLSDYSFPPTPPISPGCSSLASEIGDPDRIQPVCDDFAEDLNFGEEKSLYFQEGDLKDILIKDCMWNGAAFESCTDKGQTAPSKHKLNTSRLERIRLLCQTPPIAEFTGRVLSVDPTEIFPFPINADSSDNPRELEASDSEEEVEVDVVTIENSVKREGEVNADETPDENLEAEESETAMESWDSLTPSEMSPLEDFDDDKSELTGKIRSRKTRKSYSQELTFYKQARKTSKVASISGSGESDESENDSEYTRATHNVLERKRRNDLKLKFQRLRDAVPELKDNERAPKVSILRKSWQFIDHLKEEELKLVAEFEKQKKMNALLLKKLLSLNKAHQ